MRHIKRRRGFDPLCHSYFICSRLLRVGNLRRRCYRREYPVCFIRRPPRISELTFGEQLFGTFQRIFPLRQLFSSRVCGNLFLLRELSSRFLNFRVGFFPAFRIFIQRVFGCFLLTGFFIRNAAENLRSLYTKIEGRIEAVFCKFRIRISDELPRFQQFLLTRRIGSVLERILRTNFGYFSFDCLTIVFMISLGCCVRTFPRRSIRRFLRYNRFLHRRSLIFCRRFT